MKRRAEIAALNSAIVSYVASTSSFATRFARCSVGANTTRISACPVKASCVGGVTTDDDSATCKTGHRGPYCSVCQADDYAKSGDDCVRCEGSATNTVVIGIIFVIASFIGLFYLSVKISKLVASPAGLDIDKQHELIADLEKKLMKMRNRLMKIKVKAK